MRTAALVCFLAAAAIFAPSVISRALRNRRIRQARAQARAECHANYWLDSSDPIDVWALGEIAGHVARIDALVQDALETDWRNDPTPEHDRLVCEQMEKAEGWAS